LIKLKRRLDQIEEGPALNSRPSASFQTTAGPAPKDFFRDDFPTPRGFV
jgi:hypothetical protein